jgi:hypothetical protein
MTRKALTAKRSPVTGLVTLFAVVGLTTASCGAQEAAGSGAASHVQLAAAGAGPGAAAEAPGAASAAPGTDPAIQRWFKDNEKARIRFNNDLLQSERDIAAANGTTNCSALLRSAATIRGQLAKLRSIKNGGPAIADAYTPPLDEFSAAATACVKKDYPGARTILGDTSKGAIADYGDAQEKVDEILDGGA